MLVSNVAIPLAFVGLAGIVTMWESTRQQLNDSVQKQAELVAVAFEQWIAAQREPLAAVAAYSSSHDVNSQSFRDALGVIVKSRPHWLGVRVVDSAGRTILAEPHTAPPLSSEFLHNLLNVGEGSAGSLYTDRSQGSSNGILLISTPMRNEGAIVAEVEVTAMSEFFFREIELPGRAVLAVFGPRRHILLYSSSDPAAYLGMDMSDSPFFAALGDRRAASMEMKSPIDGISRVYGLARAGDTGAVAMVGIAGESIYAPQRQQLIRHIIFSVVALLVALTATVIIAREIALPVRRLSEAARRFGAGLLSTRCEIKAKGEIGELAQSFNTMAERIQEREEKLAELDRMKSDFVSSVSHELRTPLTTIKTLTRVLMRSELSQSERQEYLQTIATECDRQIDLVLNLLDLSRIEAGTLNVAVDCVDVGETVRSCITIGRYSAEARGHELVAEVSDDLPPALADAKALRRVLGVLVENAIKYTPEGGRITVGAVAEGDRVKISVTDNGPGIHAEDLPHVFEKFYRGRLASSSEVAVGDQPGVGLGLYLAQNLVEQIGGRIEAESRAGRGSAFNVYLPVCEEEGRRQ
jgi:signal transduction histidine kinase